MLFKQTIYRLIHPVRKFYWFVAKPTTRGVKVLLEYNHQYLMIQNTYGKPYWTFPGGGVRRSETPAEAAIREVKEEVGITIASPQLLGTYDSRFEHKRDTVYCFYTPLLHPNFVIDQDEISTAQWWPTTQLPSFQSPAVEKVIHLKALTKSAH